MNLTHIHTHTQLTVIIIIHMSSHIHRVYHLSTKGVSVYINVKTRIGKHKKRQQQQKQSVSSILRCLNDDEDLEEKKAMRNVLLPLEDKHM